MSTETRHRRPRPYWLAKWLQAPVTLTLSTVCVIAFLVPGLSSVLELDVSRVAAGEWWRVLTGHLTHWSADHLFWDLGVFVCLGYLCESRHRMLTYVTLTVSAVLISTWCVMQLNADSYRGLSGLDTALFAWLGTWLLCERLRDRDWPVVAALAGLIVCMMGKIGWEAVTGNCLFVNAADSGFVPVPLAHLIGAVVGIVAGNHMLTAFQGWVRPPAIADTLSD